MFYIEADNSIVIREVDCIDFLFLERSSSDVAFSEVQFCRGAVGKGGYAHPHHTARASTFPCSPFNSSSFLSLSPTPARRRL